MKEDESLTCSYCGKQGAYNMIEDYCCSACFITIFGGTRVIKANLVVEKPMVEERYASHSR